MDGFLVVFLLLLDQSLVLVERVIMVREVSQVGFEEGQYDREFLDIEELPVGRIETVGVGEVFLGFDNQFRETALEINLDHANIEIRRIAV